MTAEGVMARVLNDACGDGWLADDMAKRLLAALSAAGWAVVPREATWQIKAAAGEALMVEVPDFGAMWTAQLAAAQAEPPAVRPSAGKSEPPPTYTARPRRR